MSIEPISENEHYPPIRTQQCDSLRLLWCGAGNVQRAGCQPWQHFTITTEMVFPMFGIRCDELRPSVRFRIRQTSDNARNESRCSMAGCRNISAILCTVIIAIKFEWAAYACLYVCLCVLRSRNGCVRRSVFDVRSAEANESQPKCILPLSSVKLVRCWRLLLLYDCFVRIRMSQVNSNSNETERQSAWRLWHITEKNYDVVSIAEL